MSDSAQNFIRRNRPPRVHIKYELEKGDAEAQAELPFVMNILSDLKGISQEGEDFGPLETRKFTEIRSMDDFRAFMRKTKPRVRMTVKDAAAEGDQELPVDLTFNEMADFSPARIAQHVEPLRKLMETRDSLKHMLQLMDGRPKLNEVLQELMKNEDLMKALAESGVTVDADKPADT